jgi:uncharacterized protein YbdZ (MbtH family)
MAKPLPEGDIRILDFHREQSAKQAVPSKITLTVAIDSKRVFQLVENAERHNQRVHFAGQDWTVTTRPEYQIQSTRSTPDWVEEEWPELVPFHQTKSMKLTQILLAELTALNDKMAE